MVKLIRVEALKKWLIYLLIVSSAVFITLKPQQFVDLWLTSDQQGQILFNYGHYQQANETFTNTLWQAYSAYGNEDYEKAATLYSQYNNSSALMAQANALAHARQYVKARDLYQLIISKYPKLTAPKINIKVVQAIIDEVNLLSQSQQPEQGESSKELGDDPQTGDGAERKAGQPQEVKQLSSEQLLLDDNLNKMWLRQVQKNPAQFLSQKFYMQLENQNQQPMIEDNVDGGRENDE